jgi:hypothetical protein
MTTDSTSYDPTAPRSARSDTGLPGVGTGRPRRRSRPPVAPPIHYPGEDEHKALCRLLNDPYTPEEWEQLRAEAWRRWLELVSGPDRQQELFRLPRGPGKDWPPKGAAHDGFGGGRPFHPLSVQTQGSDFLGRLRPRNPPPVSIPPEGPRRSSG